MRPRSTRCRKVLSLVGLVSFQFGQYGKKSVGDPSTQLSRGDVEKPEMSQSQLALGRAGPSRGNSLKYRQLATQTVLPVARSARVPVVLQAKGKSGLRTPGRGGDVQGP